ncbi:hypothetical protein F7O44_20815 [Phytoactinopolyspora sp. XMNu-373]|uniref:Carbohydrate kinase PfkB domain-containing protein n=1 Tax=Phytoactinopolyspora mesophila TaxID=2650750 RepID=A0A7K3M898_9ACTN|nr:hypothetical protein [Phytoactinopolyspora mesophila]
MLAHTDLVKVSTDDLQLIYGGAEEHVITHIMRLGPQAVVVTRGADGSDLHTSTGQRITIPATGKDVVSTIGAGDAVVASIVADVLGDPARPFSRFTALAGSNWTAHLNRAMNAAAMVCGQLGGQIPATVFRSHRSHAAPAACRARRDNAHG